MNIISISHQQQNYSTCSPRKNPTSFSVPKSYLALQDGSIVTLGVKGHAKYKAYSISLRWARGTSIGTQHLPLQISAAALAASSVVVELGGLAIPAGLSYGARPKVPVASTLKNCLISL